MGLPKATVRELAEETRLQDVPPEQQPYTFGKPGRDPRGRSITVVYFGIAGKDWHQAKAADDAAQVQWFDIDNLPPMAFDHDEIARCAIERLRQVARARLVCMTQPWPNDHTTAAALAPSCTG